MSYGDYSECPYLSTGGWFGVTYRCSNNHDEEISSRHYEDYCGENSQYKTDDCKYYSTTGSVCFLTLACIKKKLSNHCLELENLRTFRDGYMSTTPKGKILTKQYYEFSPKIVRAINQDRDGNRIWDEIYYCIKNCSKHFETEPNEAMEMCKSIMNRLCCRYQIPIID